MKTKKQTYYYYVDPDWKNKNLDCLNLCNYEETNLYGRKFVRVKITVQEEVSK